MKLATHFAFLSCSILIISQIVSPHAHAVTFEITKPCSTTAERVGSINSLKSPSSVGEVTISFLEREEIPFVGSNSGINSVLDTPVGDESLEVLSDSHMRAYGWCYEVDGKLSDQLVGDYLLKGPEHLRWFYGFAEYKEGAWVSFCVPAPASTPTQHCR